MFRKVLCLVFPNKTFFETFFKTFQGLPMAFSGKKLVIVSQQECFGFERIGTSPVIDKSHSLGFSLPLKKHNNTIIDYWRLNPYRYCQKATRQLKKHNKTSRSQQTRAQRALTSKQTRLPLVILIHYPLLDCSQHISYRFRYTHMCGSHKFPYSNPLWWNGACRVIV